MRMCAFKERPFNPLGAGIPSTWKLSGLCALKIREEGQLAKLRRWQTFGKVWLPSPTTARSRAEGTDFLGHSPPLSCRGTETKEKVVLGVLMF